MIFFKTNQYIQLKSPPEGVWGYIVKAYEYIDNELYLISGEANIKHNINDVLDNYKNHILKLIYNEKENRDSNNPTTTTSRT